MGKEYGDKSQVANTPREVWEGREDSELFFWSTESRAWGPICKKTDVREKKKKRAFYP